MLLVLVLSPLAVVKAQPGPDSRRDGLFGPVQSVVETNSQAECMKPGPGRYAGSVAITSYDREGNKTKEAYDQFSCSLPVIHYTRDPDGSVRSYQEVNRCGDMPAQLLLYKIVRDYDSAANRLKEEYYHEGKLISRVEYVYDRKGRWVNKMTLQAAWPIIYESPLKVTAADKFKPFTTEEVYKYGAGAFPKKVTIIRDGKALWSYSYEYVLDQRGNWTKRVAVQHPGAVKVPTLKTVACRELTYY